MSDAAAPEGSGAEGSGSEGSDSDFPGRGSGGHHTGRTTLDRVLDAVVFVPIGLASDAVDQLPQWAAKGRESLGMQVSNARVTGQFVLHKAERDLGRRLQSLRPSWAGRRAAGRAGTSDAGDSDATDRPSEEDDVLSGLARDLASPTPTMGAGPTDLPSARATTAAAGAAIEGYDSLSASQVVRRLQGLGPDELRAVYRHEVATRGRRTILHRVQQLLHPDAAAAGNAGGAVSAGGAGAPGGDGGHAGATNGVAHGTTNGVSGSGAIPGSSGAPGAPGPSGPPAT